MSTDATAAAPPPPIPTGNENVIFPIERQSQVDVLAVSIAFIIIPTVAVGLRFLARRVAHRRLDASDYCILASCACSNALQAVAIVLVLQCGAGYHFEELLMTYGMAPITKFLKILIPVQLLWACSLSFCKLSILLLYSRIFTARPMVIASWITAGVIVAWAAATILSGFLICRPFALNWNQDLDGECGDQVLSYTITGAFNLVTDVIVFLLPMPYLWSLQLRFYKKLVLVITFSMGLFTIIISTMRLVSLQELDYNDITYNIPHALIFGALEPSVGVTLACLPLLRPLLGRTKYSGNGTAQYNVSSDAPSKAMRNGTNSKNNGFSQIDDDSSQYQLHPLARKNETAITTHKRSGDEHSDISDEQPLGNSDDNGVIIIQKHWRVTST